MLARSAAFDAKIRQVHADSQAYDYQREVDNGRDQCSGAELGEEGEDARAPGEEHVDADHQQDRRGALAELHAPGSVAERGVSN